MTLHSSRGPARWWLRAGVAGMALALVAALPPVSPAGGHESAAAPADPRAIADTRVTLITGDRVLLAEEDGEHEVVTVEPGPGRAGMGFQRYEQAGRVFVVPLDAVPLLGRGRVDRRLFDVTLLVRFGYDDRSRTDLPLIVTSPSAEPSATDAIRDRVAIDGATVTEELPSVAAIAVREGKTSAVEFWAEVTGGSDPAAGADGELAPELTRIWLDGPVQASLDESVPQIGAPAAWEAGHTGGGAEVAVLDTGIDETHADLADAVVAAQDFTGNSAGPRDGHGHGTHVASIITGSGAASGGLYAGVAPDAGLLVGKVLNDAGFGFESDVIGGMEWAAAQDAEVVNMSLGAPFPGDGTGLLDQVVDRLTADTGTLFVVAAGNGGPEAETVTSPGSADSALTVGAVDDHDTLVDFSSRGPRATRPAVKPDITAPGAGIVAARGKGTSLGEPVGEDYTRLSGTSMATPHAAAAAAILAGQHPDWGAEQLKGAVMGSAAPQDGQTVYEEGAGRLDVARADAQPVYATPATISNGLVEWPHEDDQAVATPVTYHNAGVVPLTLDLALDVTDVGGQPAPDGMFAVSVDRVTVPAGGEASVTVTVDTTVPGPDGLYGGLLTATAEGGGVVLHTPVGVTKEIESYDVTFDVVDRNGVPTDLYDVSLVDVGAETFRMYRPYDPSGRVTVRLPAATYLLQAVVGTPSGAAGSFSQVAMVEPSFTLTRDVTITVDARQGRRVGATVDRRASIGHTVVHSVRETTSGPFGAFVFGPEVYARPSDTVAPVGQFTFQVQALLARADGAGGFAGSPYLYHIEWSRDRRVPRQLTPDVADSELAVVRSTHAAASSQPTTATREGGVTMTLPGRLTEYYTPGVPWPSTFATASELGTTAQWARLRTFELGQRYRERWNGAVFGPMDPSFEDLLGPQLTRFADGLNVFIPLFSDQAGHWAHSSTDLSTLTLHRDGETFPSVPFFHGTIFFGLPADEASYRLEATATRSVFDLSTQVDAAWTFRSALVAGDDVEPVPLLGVRFTPRLDDHNRAPSGQEFTFPVHVGRQPGAQYGTLDSLAVDVSYDDGETWEPVQLSGTGDDQTATVTHPAGAGYVSLRAHASDSAGNGVEQTIIHAYALGG